MVLKFAMELAELNIGNLEIFALIYQIRFKNVVVSQFFDTSKIVCLP